MSLSNSSVRDLIAGLQAQRFTSFELVQGYLARIEQANPTVRAVNAVTPNILDVAKLYDSERESGLLRGSLHGIPILVKDFEATVIKKLRDAGAIILGKASCSEWVNFRSPEKSISGWSVVGGQGIGIYAIDQSALGSSSGSAIASSLGLAAVALGTETSGSISSPARASGIVGLKPTVVLTSRHGVYCVTEWEDSVGVLGKTVLDAAAVLTAMAGIDELDVFTSADPRDEGQTLALRPTDGTDFTVNCQKNSLRGLRIAVQVPITRPCIEQPEVVNTQFNEALKKLEALGATVVDNVEFTMWSPRYSDIKRAE
ncbi:hypothetical protein HYALB_00007681 [Hymenoscyphus albidus]|uniref:Amidase domain-containing protein n=1 Tax=Hymenoscyphus albidus TaxID=595503 RepID=A0A9N9LGR0_9HELO|nr:hypothetical protein HYALB_00007681 [Hymenoscyphus albidus]